MSIKILPMPLLAPETSWFSFSRRNTARAQQTRIGPETTRKRKAAPPVKRSLTSELNTEEQEAPRPRAPKRQKTEEKVNLSLSRAAWEFVLRLLRSQPPSRVPEELLAIADNLNPPTTDLAATAPTPSSPLPTENTAKISAETMSEPEKENSVNASQHHSKLQRKKKAKPARKVSVQARNTCIITARATSRPQGGPADAEVSKCRLKPLLVEKDALVGKPILVGTENKDGWSEATCHSSGTKIHYQVCRNSLSSGNLCTMIHENHVHLIGRAFADKTQMQAYSEEDAGLTAAMLREEDTISFSVWAFGSCRAKEKTLAGTAIITRAMVDQHSDKKVFALALIAVDRQWRQYGIGRNLLERIEKELRDQEKAHFIVAHGLRPNMYLKNGYQLDPQELPCPFKPMDRAINFFGKALHGNPSLNDFKDPTPGFIRLVSDSLRTYYSDYQPALVPNSKPSLEGSRVSHPQAIAAALKIKPSTAADLQKMRNTTQKDDSPDNSRTQRGITTRTTWTSYAKHLTITCINATNIIERPRRSRQSLGIVKTNHGSTDK